MIHKKAGITCIILGAVLIGLALLLQIYNQYENKQAGLNSAAVLPELQHAIQEHHTQEYSTITPPAPIISEVPVKEEEPLDQVIPTQQTTELPVVSIDEHDYIGYLSIPSLGLELPVMSKCTYPGLKISPCRQFGAPESNDLVIAGHNYKRHFGYLKQLHQDDMITFTDMNNEVYTYSVIEVAVMEPTCVDEVKNFQDGMILYTCTYGGKTRVVVSCKRVYPEVDQLLLQ